MKLNSIPSSELEKKLATIGLKFQTGPFSVHLQTSLPSIINNLSYLYGQYLILPDDAFSDYHVKIDKPNNLRRFIKPQVYFYLDGQVPFKPLPISQAMPIMEWGLNWCISNHAHQYFILHAAVIEKNGVSVILPAQPGAGKSTLSAGLMLKGWRLLSDELALVDLITGKLISLARPVNLKNESIEVIKNFSPQAVMSEPVHDTNKGTVALLGASNESVCRASEAAEPTYMIMPQYLSNSPAILKKESKAVMFMHAADNSFNYSLLGVTGFNSLSRLIDQCQCYRFEYSRLDDAVDTFDNLLMLAHA